MSDHEPTQLPDVREKLQKKHIWAEGSKIAFSSAFATVAVMDGLGSVLASKNFPQLDKLNYGAMIVGGAVGGVMGIVNASQHNSFVERLNNQTTKDREPLNQSK